MSQLTTAELPLLHVLRLVGAADIDRLSAASGLPVAAVERGLARPSADGLARIRGAGREAWVLTDAGRRVVEERLADELDRLGTAAEVRRLYVEFQALNRRVLDLCSEWQLREVDGELVVNDHRDSVHDRWVLTRLQATHREARPVLQALASAAPWFGGYLARLDSALDEVIGGQHQWLDSPAIDSYHSVWFELHEDLLASLGIDRHAETRAAADGLEGGDR